MALSPPPRHAFQVIVVDADARHGNAERIRLINLIVMYFTGRLRIGLFAKQDFGARAQIADQTGFESRAGRRRSRTLIQPGTLIDVALSGQTCPRITR
jgi:hypothetical protein